MKWKFLVALFLTIGSISWQIKPSTFTKLDTFTSMPGDMQGAGESFYLSAQDKKAGKFICTTNYETALIYINQKPVRLKTKDASAFSKSKQLFKNGAYTLVITEGASKKAGDENYMMKGTVTLEYNSNVIWKKNVTGEGGD